MTKFGSIFLTKSIHLYVDFCQKWPFLALSHFIGRKQHWSENTTNDLNIPLEFSNPIERLLFFQDFPIDISKRNCLFWLVDSMYEAVSSSRKPRDAAFVLGFLILMLAVLNFVSYCNIEGRDFLSTIVILLVPLLLFLDVFRGGTKDFIMRLQKRISEGFGQMRSSKAKILVRN